MTRIIGKTSGRPLFGRARRKVRVTNIGRLLTSIATLCAITGPAHALVFNLTDIGGAAEGTAARKDFDVAAQYWSSILTSNATVDLDVGFKSFGSAGFNTLGETNSGVGVVTIQDFESALAAHATSTIDAQAVANLPTLTAVTPGATPSLSVTANAIVGTQQPVDNKYTSASTRVDNDGTINNQQMLLTSANAKALGITNFVQGPFPAYGSTDGADGLVEFNSDQSFDFNPSNGIGANLIDFLGVAIHEIGHALGFDSGVDTYDLISAPGSPYATFGADLETEPTAFPLDLFRYSAPDTLDWSTGGSKYLSLDDGQTELLGDAALSTGTYNGDGLQASHWKHHLPGQSPLGIMDPGLDTGQMEQVTALDVAAFDLIGWDTSFDAGENPGYLVSTAAIYDEFTRSAVPEPASWSLIGLGLVGAGWMRRRRVGPMRSAR